MFDDPRIRKQSHAVTFFSAKMGLLVTLSDIHGEKSRITGAEF